MSRIGAGFFKDRKKPALVLSSLVVLLALTGGVPAQGLTEDAVILMGWEDPTPFTEINGIPTPIAEGSVIGEAVPSGELCLVVQPIMVGEWVLDEASSHSKISWEFDSNCRAVVTDISTGGLTGPPPSDGTSVDQLGVPLPEIYEPLCNNLNYGCPRHAASAHRHTVWVKYTIFEQFNVTATESYDQMSYYQNQNSVYGGHNPSGYCYHSGFPGWHIENCHYRWNPYGPNSVWMQGSGHYWNNNPPRPNYTMESRVIAYSGPPGWVKSCWLSQGSIPRSWGSECNGART
jgi:hypothetical protein